MRKKEIERILEQVAKNNHTTPTEVRKEMILAMEEGQASEDPLVQARWAMIPRKGQKLTLEEFLEHLAERVAK